MSTKKASYNPHVTYVLMLAFLTWMTFSMTNFRVYAGLTLENTRTSSAAAVAASDTSASCYSFTRNLSVGSPISSTEASYLHKFLLEEGISGSPFATYNQTVKNRVIKFQNKYSAGMSNGYFGPETREKMNSLHGCNNTIPEISFLTPSQADVLYVGKTYNVDWTVNWKGNVPAKSHAFDITIQGDAGKELLASSFVATASGCQAGVSDSSVCTYRYSFTPSNKTDSSYKLMISIPGTESVGYSGLFQIKNSIVGVKADALVHSADTDVVSPTTFSPGKGASGLYSDWSWVVTVEASGLTAGQVKHIDSITIYQTLNGGMYGEGWSTSASAQNDLNKSLYPLRIYGKEFSASNYDEKLPASFDLTSTQTSVTLNVYGQVETTKFFGGYMIIKFSDGTFVKSTIPSSAVMPASNFAPVSAVIDASTPMSRVVQISKTVSTDNVALLVFDLKSPTTAAALNVLKVNVNTSHPLGLVSVARAIKLKANGAVYTGMISGSTVTFYGLKIPLPAGVNVPLTILADIQADTSGSLNNQNLTASFVAETKNAGMTGPDGTYMSLVPGTVTGSIQTLSSTGVTVGQMIVTLGNTVTNNNVAIAREVSFKYTLTAANETIFVSQNPKIALETYNTGYTTTNSSLAELNAVTVTPSELAGDVEGSYFVVPAGSSRQFVWYGSIGYEPGAPVSSKTFSIEKINYGISTSNLRSNNIDTHGSSLKAVTTI